MEKEKKSDIFIRETETDRASEAAPEHGSQRTKKMLIYVLMTIAFVGCMFLIFKPKGGTETEADKGLNNAVPQAGDAVLQDDKEKAYEQELLEKKQNEKRNAMMSLSDYFNNDSTSGTLSENPEEESSEPAMEGKRNYQEIQRTLGSFYEKDHEKDALRKEIRELREKANAAPQPSLTEDPVAMMEKSYQMAAKYLPQLMPTTPKPAADTSKASLPKRHTEAIYAANDRVVSSLNRNREQSDEEFMKTVLSSEPGRLFSSLSQGFRSKDPVQKNSIKACIQYTQTITLGSSVPLRLLEPARVAGMTIPAGTILTATAAIRGGRLGLDIASVEYKGNIVPVEISAYDLDGQPGLNLPYSPEVNAFKEIASGMSNSAGTNITLSSSTGQQLISDLTKGVVQGTAGYLSKRIGTPKVTVKSGHLIFLLAKKQ